MLRLTTLNSTCLFGLLISTLAIGSEVINSDEALKKLQNNEVFQEKLDRLNKQANQQSKSSFQFGTKGINDSELAKEAINKLVDKAKKASTPVNTNNRGNVTEAQYRTGIADEEMARVRYEALQQHGINPEVSGYIFVSESMPESLIRAYSRDATRLGMSLVFKGIVDKGSIEDKFLEMSQKYHTRRNVMSVQADSRLYDAFEITHVPSIVVSDIASLALCDETGPEIDFKYKTESYSYNACNKAPEDRFCKISGSIFTDWGLKTMAEKGCDMATNFLEKAQENPATAQNTIDEKLWEKYVQSYNTPEAEWTEYEKEIYKMMQGDFK